MQRCLILIADPVKAPLTEGHAREAMALGRAKTVRWLSDGEALEVDFAGKAEEAEDAFGGAGVDVAILPAHRRRKRLLLADMDSTMIGQECIDELAAEIGVGDEVAAITERAMRGEIAFEPALRERVALLRGLSVEAVHRVIDGRITPTPGARTLLTTMRAHGAYTALVSGGFTAFTAPVAARIGFDEQRANVLVERDGRFTGKVEEPILGREAKRARLDALLAEHRLEADDALAVGDGANDADMVEAAGLGVAYRAKPALEAVADARIRHGDLTALLFLQGYASGEFADG